MAAGGIGELGRDRLVHLRNGRIHRCARVIRIRGLAQRGELCGAIRALRECRQQSHQCLEARAAALMRVAIAFHQIARRGDFDGEVVVRRGDLLHGREPVFQMLLLHADSAASAAASA